MNKELESDITWCAIVILWINISRISINLLKIIHYEKKEEYLKEFYHYAYKNLNS